MSAVDDELEQVSQNWTCVQMKWCVNRQQHYSTHDGSNTTTVLRPFVRDYPGEPVPEETLTRPPSWSSSSLSASSIYHDP